MDRWNRCVYCGRFIGHADFREGFAIVKYIAPLSEFTGETQEVYHILCADKNRSKIQEIINKMENDK